MTSECNHVIYSSATDGLNPQSETKSDGFDNDAVTHTITSWRHDRRQVTPSDAFQVRSCYPMPMTTVGIIGYGWLGTRLSRELHTHGYRVWGSVRHLETAPLSPIPLIEYTAPSPMPFPPCDMAVIAIPMRRGHHPPDRYREQISVSCHAAMAAGATMIAVTISTGIYGVMAGQVTETTPIIPTTDRQAVMCAIERDLEALPITTLSVRLAGLFGHDRLIVDSLARSPAPRPDGPVNLIHETDVATVITTCLNQRVSGQLNLVAPEHPLRSQVYTAWAEQLGLPRPSFTDEVWTKTVNSDRLALELGVTLSHPSPRDWLGR